MLAVPCLTDRGAGEHAACCYSSSSTLLNRALANCWQWKPLVVNLNMRPRWCRWVYLESGCRADGSATLTLLDDLLRPLTPCCAATSQNSSWKCQRRIERKINGGENARRSHWAQLCPPRNQINKVRIKRKEGTEQSHSLITGQLGNLKSISGLTCWHMCFWEMMGDASCFVFL